MIFQNGHQIVKFENVMSYISENNNPITLEIVVPHIWQDISMTNY